MHNLYLGFIQNSNREIFISLKLLKVLVSLNNDRDSFIKSDKKICFYLIFY